MNGLELVGICIAGMIGLVAAFWVILDVVARYPLLCGGVALLAVGCATWVSVDSAGAVMVLIGVMLLIASGAKEG